VPLRVRNTLTLSIALVGVTLAAPPPDPLSPTSTAPMRTPDGQPDLQGYWSNASLTPLERPKELGNKAFYTAAQAAAATKKEVAAPEATGPGTYADVHYNMAQYGLDKTQLKLAANLRTSLITDPPDGQIPLMTPEGLKRNADRAALRKGHEFDGPENRGLAEQCILWGNEGPPMMPVGYNSNLQIVQGPGYVAILQEMIHDVRMIPTDNSPHLPPNIRQWFGDSRGHWEGDTLVVDTTNFRPETAFHGSSESLHVVERFRRVDADTILYQFTVDDPSTWTRPWSGEIPMTRIKGRIFEYACHEGNYGIVNSLSGARAEERKQEQVAK